MNEERPQVESHAGLKWIRGSGVCRDWNGIRYKPGMSGTHIHVFIAPAVPAFTSTVC